DRNRSHWSTSKTPSYTKSVSWQHHPWGGEEIKADAATTFTATKIFASDALTNGSLAKNLMFAQTTKGVLETGIYRGVVSIYLSQDI
ncbi:CS1 type fimbrial major subunit, partial [Escherichia coli]